MCVILCVFFSLQFIFIFLFDKARYIRFIHEVIRWLTTFQILQNTLRTILNENFAQYFNAAYTHCIMQCCALQLWMRQKSKSIRIRFLVCSWGNGATMAFRVSYLHCHRHAWSAWISLTSIVQSPHAPSIQQYEWLFDLFVYQIDE